MAAAQIENFSKPQQFHWNWHFLTLEFDVPIERAERILEAAVRQGQAEFGVNTKVIARVREPNERGMEYVVVYRVPEYRLRGRMRAAIMRSIMHHFAVAGIRMVYPKYNIYTADMPLPQLEQQPNPHDLLQRVTLFTALDEAEMASLAARMTPHMFTAGEAVVEQGEIGTSMYSMYIVAEGLLYVYITQPESGDLIKVAELIPGQFFGEMSLLTGEPRSATVKAETDALVYEITKADMELLLDKRPEIAEHLAEIIAKRRLQNAEFMQNLPAEQQEVEVQNFAAQLLDKVRSFFGVFRGAAAKDQS